MIETGELRNVVQMGLRDIHYAVGPFITLIDGPSFPFQWEERPKLILAQIQGADIVALSRADLVDSEQIKTIRNTLKDATSDLILLSKQSSSVIDNLAQKLLSMGQDTQNLA